KSNTTLFAFASLRIKYERFGSALSSARCCRRRSGFDEYFERAEFLGGKCRAFSSSIVILGSVTDHDWSAVVESVELDLVHVLAGASTVHGRSGRRSEDSASIPSATASTNGVFGIRGDYDGSAIVGRLRIDLGSSDVGRIEHGRRFVG